MTVIVIVIVLSRRYDRGVDIRVLYARTGCLVDMVTGEYHMHGFQVSPVFWFGYFILS